MAVGLRVLQIGEDVHLDDEPADGGEHERSRHRAARAREGFGHRGFRRDGFFHTLRDRFVVGKAIEQHSGGGCKHDQQDDLPRPGEQRARNRLDERVDEIPERYHEQRMEWSVAREHLHPAQDHERPSHTRCGLHEEQRDVGLIPRCDEQGVGHRDADSRPEELPCVLDADEIREERDGEKRAAVESESCEGERSGIVRPRIEIEQTCSLQEAEADGRHDGERHHLFVEELLLFHANACR